MEPLKSNTVILLGMHGPTYERWDYQKSHRDGHEIWGMSHDQNTLIHATRAFEVHTFEAVVDSMGMAQINRLKETAQQMPLYTPVPWPFELGPKHEVIPYHELHHITELFESSLGYMMAIAINSLLKDGVSAPRIELYGFNMSSEGEYGYQRPNAHYLCGFARGVGITVHVPDNSALFKSYWKGGVYGVRGNEIAVGDFEEEDVI